MNLLLISNRKGRVLNCQFSRPSHFFAAGVIGLGLCAGSAWLGYQSAPKPQYDPLVEEWKLEIAHQKQRVAQIEEETQADINALTSRLGLLQAQMTRIDALGGKLVHMAKLEQGEFNFAQPPALGGPVVQPQEPQEISQLSATISDMQQRLEDRQTQLTILEQYLLSRNLQDEAEPSGRPIRKGWLSSYYGMRNHPLSGKREMHKGIDFAGKLGSDVVSVAKGVVTYSGRKYGYGKVIDINHGNGYVTRYAHNQANLVKVGDKVDKGATIAEMGTSGRSTGPHVHFEVLHNNKPVNPKRFINASR